MTWQYGTRDYRNKQVMLSNEVYGNIDYTDNIFVGYSDWNKKVKNTEYFNNVQFDDIWAEQYNKPILNQLVEQVNNN